MDLKKRIGMRIRFLRELRGMSIEDLAAKAKRSYPALSRIERGLTAPNLTTLELIAKGLQVPISVLFQEDTKSEGRSRLLTALLDEGHALDNRALEVAIGQIKLLSILSKCKNL